MRICEASSIATKNLTLTTAVLCEFLACYSVVKLANELPAEAEDSRKAWAATTRKGNFPTTFHLAVAEDNLTFPASTHRTSSLRA